MYTKSLNIGIYLKLKVTSRTISEKYLLNPHSGMEYNINGRIKFCPETGEKLIEKTRTITNTVYPDPYLEDYPELEGDKFMTPEYGPWNSKEFSIFLVNEVGKYSSKEIDLGEVDSIEIEMSDIKKEEIIAEFIKDPEYVPYLDAFKKEYGEFEVKYGPVIITY